MNVFIKSYFFVILCLAGWAFTPNQPKPHQWAGIVIIVMVQMLEKMR